MEFLQLLLFFSKECSNLTSVCFSYFKASESQGSFSKPFGWEWWLHSRSPLLPGPASLSRPFEIVLSAVSIL